MRYRYLDTGFLGKKGSKKKEKILPPSLHSKLAKSDSCNIDIRDLVCLARGSEAGWNE